MGRKSDIERKRERHESEDLDGDWLVWSVIFTVLALATMGLATLFSISSG